MPLPRRRKVMIVAAALGAGLFAGQLILAGGRPRPWEVQGGGEGQGGGADAGVRWPVYINRPAGPPRIETGQVDEFGRAVTVSCASCHANLPPNASRRSAADPPMQFHQGLTFDHGGLSCVSCHNPGDYNSLRLADGSSLPYTEVMQLCAQCHAPQARDWAHGAHGGMTGYWDLTRGPRERKGCIDCHDPHAPQFPRMAPAFTPRDRFLEGLLHGAGHEGRKESGHE